MLFCLVVFDVFSVVDCCFTVVDGLLFRSFSFNLLLVVLLVCCLFGYCVFCFVLFDFCFTLLVRLVGLI